MFSEPFTEQRRHTRLPLPPYFPAGSFHLETGEGPARRRYSYLRAWDVSASGIGLELPSPLEPGQPVTVRYTSREERLALAGEVVWCDRQGRPGGRPGLGRGAYRSYRVGVRFRPEAAEGSARLFLAVQAGLEPGAAIVS